MPVNTEHDDYVTRSMHWVRIRDALAGGDAVKAKGEAYLPKPSGHSREDYASYVTRAEFYPATARTLEGLVGAIFRKEPVLKLPAGKAYELLTEQATLRGEDFVTFSKRLVREVMALGRYGVLVDLEDGPQKPFVAGYCPENIINWRVSLIDRRPVLTMVVLREYATKVDPNDMYSTVLIERYLVLRLGSLESDPEGGLVYGQEVYEKSPDDKEPVFISSVLPTRRGQPLDRIPFTFFAPLDLSITPEKPPILDLVDTNLSHYRTSAELEEGAYFTGLPMYVISGRLQGKEDDATPFVVGSRMALLLEEGGSAEVLTVSGEGMGLLKELMEAKERRMAVLGARILEEQKAGVEAADTVTLRHAGENSLLASISDTCSRGLQQVLKDMLWWTGLDNPEVSFDLNKDFISGQLSPSELVQLVAAYQNGALGPEAFFMALKDGERVPNTWTKDDWLKDLDEGTTLLEARMVNLTPEPEPDPEPAKKPPAK